MNSVFQADYICKFDDKLHHYIDSKLTLNKKMPLSLKPLNQSCLKTATKSKQSFKSSNLKIIVES